LQQKVKEVEVAGRVVMKGEPLVLFSKKNIKTEKVFTD
jgi:hypothetical protein